MVMDQHSVIPESPRPRGGDWKRALGDYWKLTKPEVNFLVLVSVLVGFDLGRPSAVDWTLLFFTLLGTLLVASGTGTLNQYLERVFDGRMRRTVERPLPAGRVSPSGALVFGLLLAVIGGVLLALQVNILASFLAIVTLATYLLIYTPLKRRTPLCTVVGAFPGAMPPLIGWAAARGSVSAEAWILYALLFFWQFPHFLAIAWMYREDYERAGYLMLPQGDHEGRAMAWQVVAFSLLLIPASLLPGLVGEAGSVYLIGAVALGLAFLYCGGRLAFSRTRPCARQVLLASIIYLPLLFSLMMADKVS